MNGANSTAREEGPDRVPGVIRRIASAAVLPAIATGVIAFGIGLGFGLPSEVTVVGWNVAWAGFDVAFGGVIFATWWFARRGSWIAVPAVGAMSALQLVDVWLSLTIFYSLRERPGIAVWAFVVQPAFAILTWRFVLRRVSLSAKAKVAEPTG